MENLEQETYSVWTHGIFRGLIYSVAYSGPKTTYTFYTDFKAKKAGRYQLTAEFEALTNAPVSDQEISDAFIKSLSDRMSSDIERHSDEYAGCMRTLPQGFFTTNNVDAIIEGVYAKLSADKALNKETIENFDIACSDLMEYANTQSPNIDPGTGRDHIGE